MTKLNYINRKSEGVKLGQIVAKDLRKRVKQSTPPKSDSQKDGSPIELLLDGKNLTDDGLAEVALGLEDALKPSANVQNTKLRVLTLSRNGLTSRSLSALAVAIQASSADLEELDLSGNCICVTTDDDAHNWQTFLKSLNGVRRLALLNLGGNDLSSLRAWDVFARIYAQDFHNNESTLENLADEIHDPAVNNFSLPERLQALDLQSCKDFSESQDPGYADKSSSNGLKGLPSISLIDMSDVGLTDSGALFLSYPLAQHRWIQEYVLSSPNQTFHAHQNVKQGILYTSNDTLTALGARLLKLAETVSYEPPSSPPPVPENSPMSWTGSIDIGLARRASHTAQHIRKTSLGSLSTEFAIKTHSSPHHHTIAEDLESLRKKLQRTILEDKGPGGVELWSAAVKFLSYARRIMFERASYYFLNSQATSPTPGDQTPMFLPISSTQESRDRRSSSTAHSSSPLAAPPSNASRPETLGDPHAPETPQILRNPRNRRDSFSFHPNSTSPASRHAGEARESLKAAIRMTNQEMILIGPLPARAWTVIITELADPKGVLSKRQIQSVVNWARDRGTLVFEMEALGKPDSVQIWRVLEGMGCLEYDGRI